MHHVVESMTVTPGALCSGRRRCSLDADAADCRRQARMMLANASAGFETGLVRQLREQADVKIFEENLGISR